jgi:hypothetical protein
MKNLVAITALVIGVLLLLVPRYILPACEFAGFSRMHCSDTAQAEHVIGILLILAGGVTLLVRLKWIPLAGAILSVILFGIAIWLPVTYGYCLNPKMPCNYGMVPAIRFISVIGILIMIGAIIPLARSYGRKGSS